jgi:hypothetical protein
MLQVPAEPVELPDDKGIAGLERFQAGGQTGAVVVPAGGEILVDAVGFDAGSQQSVTLWRQGLAAVAFRDPDVADQHVAHHQKRSRRG